MSASPLLDPATFAPDDADQRMTAERVETKYLVASERVPGLLEDLTARLPPHRFVGEGANRLPGAHHFVTTIYFDTDARTHYHASIGNDEQNVKIRAKEYYDVHPSLAELATDPRQIVRYQPWVWFELKRRDGARTLKRRFRLSKQHVPEFFLRGHFSADALGSTEADASSSGDLAEVVAYCRSLGQPLRASALVNYRRLSFQERAGALRITLDLALAFFAPAENLWTRDQALVRSTLGEPRGALRQAVLEVKRRAAPPDWLDGVLARAAAIAAPFSKFVAASQAVHDEVARR